MSPLATQRISPYFYLIQRYFPPDQWENANCISTRECSPDRQGYPESCIGVEGLIDCGHGPVDAKSWGIFQVLDACWNPDLNPNSPFTAAHWAKVLDPNVNTWMASVIWNRGGWRAWTTCAACGVCEVPGGSIPYPSGPIEEPVLPPPPVLPRAANAGLLLLGGAMIYASLATMARLGKAGG